MNTANIKLTRRAGFNRTYSTPAGDIYVVCCTNPAVYVTPGYSLYIGQGLPYSLEKRQFSSGKAAALAAYKYLTAYPITQGTPIHE